MADLKDSSRSSESIKSILQSRIETLLPMLDNEARNVIEGLKSDIQQFSVNSLIPGGLVAFWNPSSDDFEVGCYASASKTEVARVELVRILSINEDRIATVLYQDGSTQYKDIKSLYSCNHGKTTLGKEILKIAKV
jgi:hypothetical protein